LRPILNKELKKAQRYFNKRDFNKVIDLLEPSIYIYRENFYFFYYLGTSFLFIGEYNSASTYLKTALKLNPKDINTKLGLAVVTLRHQKYNDAITIWLSIIDLDKKNVKARYGLELLRQQDTDKFDFYYLFENGTLNKLFPNKKFIFPKSLLVILLTFCSAFVSIIILMVLFDIINSDIKRNKEVENLLKNINDKLSIEKNEDALILYSKQQAQDQIKKITGYFKDYYDNHARFEMNKLLLSNASYDIKESLNAKFEPYLQDLNFTNFIDNDNFTYKEILKEPLFYKNIFVKWKGRIDNLNKGKYYITFDFLIDYQDYKVVEGKLPVIFDYAIDIDEDEAIELIAKLLVDDKGLITLKGSSIRRIIVKN